MAVILKGKNKGKKVTLHQWCNDWFTVEGKGVNPAMPLSPTNLKFTDKEMEEVIHHNNNGIMFALFHFEVSLDNSGWVMKRNKR